MLGVRQYIGSGLIALGVLAAAILLWFVTPQHTFFSKSDDSYYAVFLNNGQVYFGKMRFERRGFVHLTDAYYLKAKNSGENVDSVAAGDLQIVPLGSEFPYSKNEIFLNQEHITLFEILREDSQVLQAIQDQK